MRQMLQIKGMKRMKTDPSKKEEVIPREPLFLTTNEGEVLKTNDGEILTANLPE